MSDPKSSPTSKGSDKASNEAAERVQPSKGTQSDPATSGQSRSLCGDYDSSGDANDGAAAGDKPSMQLDGTGYDDEEEYKSDEDDKKPNMAKRNSSHSHMNVYTECGRHGDEWIIGPIVNAAKAVFKKK